MSKRLIALLLAAVMLLGMLAGCTAGGQTETPADAQTETDKPTTGDSATTDESHDPVTLHYYVAGWAGQEDADAVYAKANEMIREIYPWITVEFHVSNIADFPTHVALAQASGDPIDVIGTYSLDYGTELATGAYMDVTDYLGNFPALMSALPEWAYGYGVKEGRTYAFPNWQQCNYGNASIAVEKSVAEKYGLDIDKMNELIQAQETLNPAIYPLIGDFLKNARDDGNENVIFNPGTGYPGVLARGYEQVWGPLYYKWTDGTCTLVDIWETEAVTDYLKALYEFKDAGYVPLDYFEDAGPYAGKTGVDNGYSCLYFNDNAYVPNFPELRLKQWGVDLAFMQTQKSETEYYVPMTNAAGMTAVGSTCKNPEDALRFIEILYTNPDIYNLLVYGIEGEHYTKNDDGTITTLEYDGGTAGSDASYGMLKWDMGNSKMAYVNQSFTEEFNTWAFDTLAETATPSALIGFNMDTSKIATKLSQINAVVTEYQNQLVRGACSDWEATYAEFIEKLNAAGIDSVREILQAQIEVFLANK